MDKVYCRNCKYYEGPEGGQLGYGCDSDFCRAPGNTFYNYSSGYGSRKQEVRNLRYREPSLMNQDNNCELFKQTYLLPIIAITVIALILIGSFVAKWITGSGSG